MRAPRSFPLFGLSFAAFAAAQTVSVTPAANGAQASALSQPIPADFAGMGIEPSNLFSFTGGSSPNQLSINLLSNLASYSGKPPHIRLGGNTADNMIYTPSYKSWSVSNNPSSSGQGNVASDLLLYGDTYFTALDRFPAGTPITFGLNLAYQASDYIDQIVREASAVVSKLKNVKLTSFEIGNEPDLYLQNTFRKAPWDAQVYVQQWLDRAQAVYQRVLQPAGLPRQFFEPAATASTIGTNFQIRGLVDFGILNGSYVAGWNQHNYLYFVGVSGFPITIDWMMNLDNTQSQFASWIQQKGEATATGLPYFLREMASVGPIGLPGISDTFGASLWTLDFFLFAASYNISSVEMHLTDNSYASPWQPINMYGMNPHVRPNYYAWAAMAQLIGSGNGTTQVATLLGPHINAAAIPKGYVGRLRVYGVYANNALSSVVLINTNPVNGSATSKGSLDFELNLPDLKGQTLYLSTLTATGSDSRNGTTWNGLSFETSSDGTPTIADNTVYTVTVRTDGKAIINVRDSQAVIANVGSLLGRNAVLAPNGTTTSSGARSSGSSKKSDATSSASAILAAVTGGITTAVAVLGSATGSAVVSPSATPTKASAAASRSAHGSLKLAVAVLCVAMAAGTYLW